MQEDNVSFCKRKVGEQRKRHRSSVSQDVKLDVLDRHMKGERSAHIAHLLGLPPTTVRTIIKNRDKILETAKLVPKHVSLKLTRLRSDRMEKMECLLSLWLQDLYKQNAPVSLALIQEKAISLYKDIEIEGETGKPVPFSASRGWFHRFQKRYGFKNVRMQGEAVSLEKDPAEGFPEMLKNVIEEGGYDPRQVFNADETGLYWKCLPSRAYVLVMDAPGFPASKDRLSLLLGGNASGDMKLKPLLVYHSENPLVMKNYVKPQLPVIWKSHKRAWITRQIFRDWFMDHFVPETRKYCEEKELVFKVLLILDSASAHDLDFESLCPNVKVILIPPRSNSAVQPMDQGVIAKFKACYLRRIFDRLVQETGREGRPTAQEFWEEFNIMDAIAIIAGAWQDIPNYLMNCAWKNLYPEAVQHLVDIQEALVHREITQLAKVAGFQEVEEGDVKEWLISHSLPLSKEDLLELHRQHPGDANENEEKGKSTDTGLTVPVLQRIFDLYKEIVDILKKSDSLEGRASQAISIMADGLSCYRQILDTKLKHNSQTTTDIFLIKEIRRDSKLFMNNSWTGSSHSKTQKSTQVAVAEGPTEATASPALSNRNVKVSSSHHSQPLVVLDHNGRSCHLRNLESSSLAKAPLNSLMVEDQAAAASRQKEAGVRNSEIVPSFEGLNIRNSLVPPSVKQEPVDGPQERWETQWQEFLKTMESPQLDWQTPQIPLLKPEEEAEDFQAVAEAHCWPMEENGDQTRLHRDIQTPYRRLDPSVEVKEEIPDVETLSLERRCQRFRHFCYQESQGPREALRQLWERCQQWLMPEKHTIVQILELVILEQFLTILPIEMQAWVRGRSPETCVQAASLAEEFLLKQKEVEKESQRV